MSSALNDAVSAALDLRALQARGFGGMNAADEDRMLLAEEVNRLRSQLAIAARGLKHCAGWNISEDTRNALMAVVMESEALLVAGPNVRAKLAPTVGRAGPVGENVQRTADWARVARRWGSA